MTGKAEEKSKAANAAIAGTQTPEHTHREQANQKRSRRSQQEKQQKRRSEDKKVATHKNKTVKQNRADRVL